MNNGDGLADGGMPPELLQNLAVMGTLVARAAE
jgi:hypothetical protein